MIAPVTTRVHPQPGIWPGVPLSEYLAIDAVGSSSITDLLRRSPAYARLRMDTDEPPTEAMSSGSLLDCMALEPEIVAARFVPKGECEALLKSGARAGKPCGLSGVWYEVEEGHSRAYCGKHKPADAQPDPRETVTAAEWETDALIAARMRDHPDIGRMLAEAESTQITLVWQDKRTGLYCKARPDLVAPGYLADLKRNVTAHPERWPWEVYYRGYHIQAAHYLSGAAALGMPQRRWRWMVVDSTPPHEMWAPWCDEESLLIGKDERAVGLDQIATCREGGYWPGYPTGDIETGVPDAIKQAQMGDGQVATFSED